MTDHPITPPQELINKWWAESCDLDYCEADDYLYRKIAQWGYKQAIKELQTFNETHPIP